MTGSDKKPAPSSAVRMAATTPSIIDEGATMSAPARAAHTAAAACRGREASLSTSPPRRTPQWPCEVYSHRQMSAMTSSCPRPAAHSSLMRRTARGTGPPSSHAPLPSSSLRAGTPKSISPAIPARRASFTTPSRRSTV